MADILNAPVPQPPEPLTGLSEDAFGMLVVRNPQVWLQWIKDNIDLLEAVRKYASSLKDQLDRISPERHLATEPPSNPEPTEPLTDSGIIGPTMIPKKSFYINHLGLKHIRQLVRLLPDGSRPTGFAGGFSQRIKEWIDTKATVYSKQLSYVERVPDLYDEIEGVADLLDLREVERLRQQETETRVLQEDAEMGANFANLYYVDPDHIKDEEFDIVASKEPRGCKMTVLTTYVPFEGGKPVHSNQTPVSLVLETHLGFFAVPNLTVPSVEGSTCRLLFRRDSLMLRTVNPEQPRKVDMWLKARNPMDLRYAATIERRPGVFQYGVGRRSSGHDNDESDEDDDDEDGGPPNAPMPPKKRKIIRKTKKGGAKGAYVAIQDGVVIRRYRLDSENEGHNKDVVNGGGGGGGGGGDGDGGSPSGHNGAGRGGDQRGGHGSGRGRGESSR